MHYGGLAGLAVIAARSKAAARNLRHFGQDLMRSRPSSDRPAAQLLKGLCTARALGVVRA